MDHRVVRRAGLVLLPALVLSLLGLPPWSGAPRARAAPARHGTMMPAIITQQQELAPLQSAYFGYAVALSADGSTVLVGGRYGNAAYVFARQYVRGGPTWIQQQTLIPGDGTWTDGFGNAVALSADGSTILVGAPGKNGGAGAAYVFVRGGAGWVRQQEITAADASGFGGSVALSADGSTALVGADGNSMATGAAYVFARAFVRGAAWIQQQELTASDAAPSDFFGASVALSGDGSTALVGAPDKYNQAGAAYILS